MQTVDRFRSVDDGVDDGIDAGIDAGLIDEDASGDRADAARWLPLWTSRLPPAHLPDDHAGANLRDGETGASA